MEDWVAEADLQGAKAEVSCGIVVKETDAWVTIALSFAPETKQYGQVISIPMVAIKDIQYFDKPAKQRAKRGKVQAQEVGGVRLAKAGSEQLDEAEERVRGLSS